mgnify:CR=1 FL=1
MASGTDHLSVGETNPQLAPVKVFKSKAALGEEPMLGGFRRARADRGGRTREVREETGIEMTDLRLLTTVDLIEREPDGRVRYHYTLVDFIAEAPHGEPVAGEVGADEHHARPDHELVRAQQRTQ